MSKYIIYRERESGKILKYSIFSKEPQNLDEMIETFNKGNGNLAELVSDDDIKALIEISEDNKRIKESDIRSIEDAFDSLQTEIYHLKESVQP